MVSEIQERLHGLSPEKRRLFELLQKERDRTAAKRHSSEAFSLISPEDRERLPPDVEDAYPLTMMQAGMIYHMELSTDYLLYQNVDSWHLRAAFDHARLEEAVQRAVARHDTLRTSIDLKSYSEPLQLVHRKASLPVSVEDLRHLPAEAQQELIDAYIEGEKRRPIDKAVPPLLRFKAHLRSDEAFQFTLTEFHPILDGWSLQLTLSEILTCYSALMSGSPPPPAPPLAVRFREFVRLEREALRSQEHKRYWRETLERAHILELPRWPPRFRPPGLRPVRTEYVAVADEVFASLKSLAEHHRLPLKSFLLAAHLKLLSLLSGQPDVLTGIISHGRPEEVDGEQVRGLFLNSVPFRYVLEPGSWLDLARGVFAKEQEILPFSRYPLAAIQRDLAVPHLIETAFNLTHFHVYRGMPRLTTSVEHLGGRELEENSFTLEVTFNMDPAATRLLMVFMYHATEVAVPQLQAISRYLGEILSAMAASPGDPHEAAVLLPSNERHLLLEWNDTAVELSGATFSELFLEQAWQAPERVAVAFHDRQLTYGELAGVAGALAAAVARHGIGPESLVGIFAARSPELLSAVLGVLGCGAAFLPLDPLWPVPRLAQVLAQSGAALLLADRDRCPRAEEVLGEIPAARRPRLLPIETLLAAAPPPHPTPASPGLDTLAYVIYTSGSTGTPRGVMVHQRGMLNHLRAKVDALALCAADCMAQTASVSFDISVWQLLNALLVGGRVLILDDEVAHDPALLLEEVERREVSIVEVVPSLLRMLLEELRQGRARRKLPGLRRLLLTGEALPPELAREWLRLCPGIPLVNAYGPTECSDDVTHHEIAAPPDPGEIVVPIGRALGNTRLYVLDRSLRPLPTGSSGQLFVGGMGIGRGYLADPARTAEVFLPDPFAEEPGARLYATGDLARFRPDGSLDFLGRIDFQVKLRGFRIELGEIESALASHPGVRQAAVLARPGAGGDLQLVAYVVPRPEHYTLASLVEHLRRSLPEYMVPSAFVALEALPLTPNGKLDRRALPAPAASAEAGDAGALAHDPIEQLLIDTWTQVLGRPPASRTESFFEAGGHSLLATQLASRLRQSFAVELPLRTLFEAPSVATLAGRLRALLRAETQEPLPPLARVADRGADLPLSFAQQRLWFLDQLEPGSPLYNMPLALAVDGDLDPAVLARCFDEAVRRHETLRTVFRPGPDEPRQVVLPAGAFALPVIDLSGLPAGERERASRERIAANAVYPFDLARGPLLRTALLRLGPGEHIALVNIHHIVSDGWSMGVLTTEIATLYRALAAGEDPALPTLPVQYGDFTFWQRGWLAGERLDAELAFWRDRLAGLPPLLDLPLDRPRPAVATFCGAVRPVALPDGLAESLRRLGNEQQATLFMTLLAGLSTLLARYSRQPRLAVGSPIAGRHQIELEPLIGFFVNTLVLPADLTGSPRFAGLLRRLREVCLEAYAHQDLPFEKLVEELAPERSLAYSPLFQVLFVLQNAPRDAVELPALRLRPLDSPSSTAKFDLTLTVEEARGGALGAWIEYNTDLFDAATIQRLGKHLGNLLAAAAADPQRGSGELPMLDPAEHRQVEEWNDTAAPIPVPAVHELFEIQAARTPEAVAAVFGAQEMSYRELDEAADRLARTLRGRGIAPDVPVGICLEPSLAMVVAVLAVLKAGGTYLPLDPAYPQERLRAMVDDARPPVLLSQEALLDRLPETSAQILCLDRLPAVLEWEAFRSTVVDPDHLGYVIYTSGSTGQPKGIGLPHRALVNLILWHLDTLLGGVRTLQFASLSFDASFHEMFACWASGGTLVLIPETLRRDVRSLASFLVEKRIEKVILPVLVLQQLAEIYAEPGRELPVLREVTTTGEQMQITPPVIELFQRLPGCELHNHYGPSESHVVTAHRLGPVPGLWVSHPPAGRPVSNCRIELLDPELGRVPEGVAGELYIGGVCLARGYLGRPELTAERFVPDPWSAVPGERMYRTGDLARYRRGGDVEYLGRLDHQVKIRGFRVEPAEVEAALVPHPALLEAVVVAMDAPEGGKRLVAYLVGRDEQERPSVAALRGFLAERLPHYMLPAAFVWLDRLPLTPNGKVDRRALPQPEAAQRPQEAAYRPPVSATEQIVAALYGELLGHEPVGLDDDFFTLGGHSLLATRLASRLRQSFAVELPLRQLFETPTVAALAFQVEQARRREGALPLPPPIRPVPRDRPLPLSFAQQRLWFLDQLEPGSPLYNLPLALRIDGELAAAALADAFEAIVRRHEALRTVFLQDSTGEPLQVVQTPSRFVLPLVDLSGLPAGLRDPLARDLATAEAWRPFDLARGPLLRTSLLRFGLREHVVLLTMHHTVSDGWSLDVMVREMSALYAAFSANRPSPLPELPIQYPDYAVWQRQWLQGEVLADELAHWRRQLAGAPQRLELPTDRPRPAVQSFRGATRGLAVNARLAQELRQLSRTGGATLFMTLLAAFQLLLARYAGQDDVVVGSPVANRTHGETEGLIGFFVNTLALRARIQPEISFADLLAQVREVTLAAYTHQELPFEKLVEELQPERALAHSPLFQVMLLLQNTPAAVTAPAGLSLSPLAEESTGAKFDLTFALREGAEGLLGSLEYNCDLFDATSAERLLEGFARLLQAAISMPEEPVFALDLLGEAQRQQITVEWGQGAVAVRLELCLDALFVAQARRTPDAVAVVFGEDRLSYRELDRRAGRLAHRLRALGVGPEVPVGICAERSLDLVVGLLAILKAGGAYLPLDPDYPVDRLAFMAADARLPVLLLDRRGEQLPDLAPGAIRLPLTQALRDDGDLGEEPVSTALPGNAAYLIYTSGSTGRPKGVVNTHAGILNRLLWMQRHYPIDAADGVLQKTPVSFDISVWELFWPLITGARLVLARPGGHRDGAYLVETLAQAAITAVHFVPSMLGVFLEESGLLRCSSLRWVFVSGEALTSELAEHFFDRLGDPLGVELHNLYGPTEAAVEVTSWGRRPGEHGRGVSIGRPIENLRALVLDATGRLVPTGASGELHLGGLALARGYLGRPELTAERFVPDPWVGRPGERLYRTGDLVRLQPDGQIGFLGRIDHQVKLRGYRIELGEIEALLLESPSVRQAVAVLRDDSPGGPRLVAYTVAAEGSAPPSAALAEHLRRRLPEHMVPTAFVALEELPLTPSGKLDRRALPAPPAGPEAATGEGIALARDPVEQLLVDTWTQVLGAPPASRTESFFASGGHSLLATQLASRLRHSFGVELPLRLLFEAPSVASLAGQLRSLLRSGARETALPPLVRGPARGTELPLSFAQQRLWFLDQLEPGSPLYNLPLALRIDGELAAAALAGAFEAIVHRHEALRTVFRQDATGQPLQVVQTPSPLLLPLVDLSGLPAGLRGPLARDLAAAEAWRPFDLARGPLLRTCLLRLAPMEHVVLLTLHHTISDGWSLDVMVREMSALYAAFSAGRPSSLPELPIQYPDYALWQRRWLQGEILAAELEHWRRQLAGAPQRLELPTDRPRPAVQSFRGAARFLALDARLARELRQLSRTGGATLFMTLLAAFQLLLARYAVQEDVVVGSPVANRTHSETEGLIGFFVNTLALRARIDPEISFSGLLAQVREVTLAAYTHQELPFEKLVEELQPERALAHSPLFQVMLLLQNAPPALDTPAGLALSPLAEESTGAKFELTLALREAAEGLLGSLEYSRDLFDGVTIERLLSAYECLLEGIVAAPEQRVLELPLLGEGERHQMQAEWSLLMPATVPGEVTIHQLFERQAERTPEAEAVVSAEERLSYGELNRQANRLARFLRRLGVGPEVRVAVLLDSPLEMVTCLLSILKAGGAYVPLDPAHPVDRLAFLLADAGCEVLLTRDGLSGAAAALGLRQLRLDAEQEGIAGESGDNLPALADADGLAYVIYTSGSTGMPKGVPITHENVVPLLVWSLEVFGFGATTRVLQSLSPAFDFGVFEVLSTLLSGGTLFLRGAAGRSDIGSSLQEIRRHRLNTLHTTPSFFRALAAAAMAAGERLPGLEVLHLGGEALSEALVEEAFAVTGPGCRLFNGYGPTEAAINCALFEVGRAAGWRPRGLASVPIGRPSAANRLHVLDRRMQPVPAGVSGELLVGGVGLSRGYLGRPSQTAERFVPDPFGAPGGRLYRTGDLVRFHGDGVLEFLGRIDDQVKIRGFRIELGEIETALAELPEVREAAVVVREDRGERRLVAYVVPAGEERGAPALRAELAGRLPDYMIPAGFVFLEALPLTPNGKTDRQRLPVLDVGRSDSGNSFIAPRTPVEEVLAAIWAEVLGLERIGAHDRFFELGGHSLLATRMISRLRDAFGVELPLRELFEEPTVTGLAGRIEAVMRAGQRVLAPAPVPVERTGRLPLSFAQERLWFIDQLQPNSPGYNIPAPQYIAGSLAPAALAAALTEIVRRHEVLRTVYAAPQGEPVQVVLAPQPFRLPVVDLSGLPEARKQTETLRLAREEAQRPFDLRRDLMLRASLLRLAPAEHAVLPTVHHIASDGWSMGVLIRELQALYEAARQGRPSPLPPLPIQYADYAVWQRGWLRGEALEAELAYWRERLAGAPPLLDLPLDRPRPAVQSARGATLNVTLPSEVSRGLKALARSQGATMFMALLAGFQALLARYSNQEDISVGTPIAGRTRSETEGLIGFFVNTLVVRTDLSAEPGLAELVAQVRERCLEAYLHQDLPFEKLVEELEVGRSLDRNPLFQVLFAFQNAPAETLALPGISLVPLDLETATAKFDLSLSLGESADGGLTGAIEYATDLLDRTTVHRFAGWFAALLTEGVAAPRTPVFSLDLLGEAQRQQVLAGWNDTSTAYPRESSIHSLFAEQAALRPEAVALVSGGASGAQGELQITYRELDLATNRLARHLRALGVGPETLVGVCLDRSIDAIVTLLAILKAGGAFVPLDPAYPEERLAFLLADTAAPVLLTEERLLARLPVTSPALQVVCLDRDRDSIAQRSGRAPGVAVSPDGLAYVMYTSGSTGRPKGVAVTHRNVVRLVRETNFANLSADQVFLQLAPLSFDASTLEIWGPLANGGRLAVLPAGQPSLAELGAALQRFGVTTLWLTAGLFHQMVESEPGCLLRLSQLLAGGDVLQPQYVRRLLEEPAGPVVVNGYGPTEGTTFTCCYPMEDPRQVRASVPIGRPIANTRAFLLDRGRLAPVPVGVAGELFAAGDGLARGYLNRPDLTAERFVPAPTVCGEAPGARLYRTGDLARFLPQGEIEFLGRIDQQVKIRGFRIELGEIEAVLAESPAIADVAVVVRQDRGERRLVAYVVPAGEAHLRAELAGRLPDYMIPADFVFLDALPLTPNRKVDRRALAALEVAPGGQGAAGEAPRTPAEEIVAGIWAEVLGHERVGAHDHFFELGGHSLLAARVVSRLRDAFGVELPLRELFEEPTVAGLAGRIEAAMRVKQRALVPALTPAPRPDRLPLSFAQERLWFIDQLQPNSPGYNIPVPQYVAGPLAPAALAAAFSEIVRRHEVLRTVYAAPQGEPLQVVLAPQPFRLPVVDLSGLPEAWRQAETLRLARAEALRPFHLSRDLMLRASLIRMTPEEHAVLATMHHIASDGWSMGILLREIQLLYEAARQGRPSPLPDLPVQYVDFAVWQRGWLRGEALEAELAYWRERLAGAPPLLDLPLDRPRPAVQGTRGATLSFALDPEVSRSLQALAHRQGATMFMVLLAGFQALLARYSNQEDISVGTPIAGRTRSEIEGLIGFFVNTLVVRTDLSGEPGLGELVARVRERSLEAHLHQELPFEKLVEEMAPERSLSHSPLFQVMFDLAHTEATGGLPAGLRMRHLDIHLPVAKFDLSLTLADSGSGLNGSLEYSTDLFDEPTVRRLLGHWTSLLEAAVRDPELRVSRLPLLAGPERVQLLQEWNDTETGCFQEECLHELFEAQVKRTPDSEAIVFESERLSYRELDERADRLAQHLGGLGVGPDVVVALCLERGIGAIVGMLAVLKAGGAYLPLDLTYPRERLAWMLDDCGASVLITEERLLDRLPESGARIACVDRDRIDVQLSGNPSPRASPGNLAYVMYTSGSTGRPQGVLVPHRSAAWYARTAARNYAINPADRVLQFASISFDISVEEIYPCLSCGATLVVATDAMALSAAYFLDRCREWGVTVMSPPTAFWHELSSEVAARPSSIPTVLRRVILGGEKVSPERVREWRSAVGPQVELWNSYGPTETTVVASLYRISGRPGGKLPEIPIGRPIADVQLRVLEDGLEPAPVGVPGELYIGGTGVARGYLGHPELTAERFVPDPFGTEHGTRLYRTRDRVRWRPDGELEFLGRLDYQVKVRGFRIELGEIETVLAGEPGVREAVVVARNEDAGGVRLIACVVPDTGTPLTVTELRSSLRDALPDYMVPSAFLVLEAMPLTPNGKVDRRALAALEVSWGGGNAGSEAPRTPAEEIVAGIWAEVLGLERVGAYDHFFELGGHSLLATRVVSRLRDAFGVELPLRDLFEEPTVAGLAGRIDATMRVEQRALAPALAPAVRTNRLPLSFAQERLWFLDQLQPNSPAYNIPVPQYVAGPLEPAALAAACNEIVRRHEVLRTVYTAPQGEPVQVVLAPRPFHLPIVDLSGLLQAARQAEALRLAGEEALRPFDLECHLMLRASLVRLAPEEHALLTTIHHIASDGWSMGIFVRELQLLYQALRQGRPSPLPPLPIQYADYAIWQRGWLQGQVLEAELAYWRERLAGAPPLLELPLDRPRPAVQTPNGTTLGMALTPEVSRSLKALARQQEATMFMVLLAGFQALLARYSGQEDISVGTPIAGRTRSEVENLIGFFVNTLVVRTDLSGEPGLTGLVARVQERSLEAYLHQDVPFEKLVEELAPERSLSHSPLFQVMLVFQNAPQERLEVSGLAASPFGEGAGTEKFDLTLALEEGPSEVVGTLSYSTDLFDGTTMQRLLGHYERLLAASVADPQRRLSELSLLGEAERQAVLFEWSFTGPAPQQAVCLHELFEAQARRTPAATALVFGEERLSYAELDRRSEELARRLRRRGVGPEVRVGVCLERRPALVISLLAVLKARGAYVPIDPAYPAARQRLLLEDSGAAVLLVRDAVPPGLAGTQAQVVRLDELEDAAGPGFASSATPGSLAYIIYTSGSTGRPKGVAIEHRSAVAFLHWVREVFSPTELAGVLASTSISFDLSVFELFAPLSWGGTAILCENALSLPSLPPDTGVTLVNTVPSAMAELAHLGALPATVRTVGLAGEALPRSLVRELRTRHGIETVWNLYGPSEDTTYSTFARMEADDPRVPAIGRPIAGTVAHVLDPDLQPLPLGIAGELCLGGAGLARGYLGRPDLTSERFVPNPFGEPGSRLYRTGDRAAHRPDGDLAFLGRIDHQVKVRGFRIELGEIETALASQPGVREAVVMARQENAAGLRLVAYVVADTGAQPTVADLRSSLRAILPNYMVPAAFVVLAALPLTPNGKIDRQRLPPPEAASVVSEQVPPRDLIELHLSRIWEEILGVETVNATDNFFSLGGHSLLAVRLMSRIRAQFDRQLPIATLFENPTLESLAAKLRLAEPALHRSALVHLQGGGAGTPLFLVHPVGGDVLCYWHLAHALGSGAPIYGLQLPDLEQVGETQVGIESLASHYLQALSTVQPQGPYHLAGWSLGGVIAFEMARQLEREGQQVSLLALIDSSAPGQGPSIPLEGRNLVRRFAEDFAGLFGLDDLDLPAAEAEALHAVYELCQTYGLVPQDLTEEEMERLFAMFRTGCTALASYRVEPYGGDLLLFASEESSNEWDDATLGWNEFVLGRLSAHSLPGNHYEVMKPPVVQEVAAELRARLTSAAGHAVQ